MSIIYNYVWIGDIATLDLDNFCLKSIESLSATDNLRSDDLVQVWIYSESTPPLSHLSYKAPNLFGHSRVSQHPQVRFCNLFWLIQSETDIELKKRIKYLVIFAFFLGANNLVKEYLSHYILRRMNHHNQCNVYMDGTVYMIGGVPLRTFLNRPDVIGKFVLPNRRNGPLRFNACYFGESQFHPMQVCGHENHRPKIVIQTNVDVWFLAVNCPLKGFDETSQILTAIQAVRLPRPMLMASLLTPRGDAMSTLDNCLAHLKPKEVVEILHTNLQNIEAFQVKHSNKQHLLLMLEIIIRNFHNWGVVSRLLINPFWELQAALLKLCFLMPLNSYEFQKTQIAAILNPTLNSGGYDIKKIEPYITDALKHSPATKPSIIMELTCPTLDMIMLKILASGSWRAIIPTPYTILLGQSLSFLSPPPPFTAVAPDPPAELVEPIPRPEPPQPSKPPVPPAPPPDSTAFPTDGRNLNLDEDDDE